jgi:hypothetical protein
MGGRDFDIKTKLGAFLSSPFSLYPQTGHGVELD